MFKQYLYSDGNQDNSSDTTHIEFNFLPNFNPM